MFELERVSVINIRQIQTIFKNTDYVRTGGSAEELKAAQYLVSECEALGVSARIEDFPVQMATMRSAQLFIDGAEITCKGYFNCGNADVEAPFYYMPGTDKVSLAGAKGKIVLIDSGVRHFLFQDLVKNGALGIITFDGNINYRDRDIDQKELRSFVAAGVKLPCVNVNVKDAVALVKRRPASARIVIDEEEYEGNSRNVIAELPGLTDEWIAMTAHYDSTSLSRGAYDNMSGCVGLLGAMEALKKRGPGRYGVRFVFCGSEERGLLGSKAYVEAHADELEKLALVINLDMIGSIMGKFIAVCTSEQKLVDYIEYMSAEVNWPLEARQGVYSSDSTPFADKGVPAVSFARIAPNSTASIHCRYDTSELLSPEQLRLDIGFITDFTVRMVNAAVCPVAREMPENVKKELDEYLLRKRPDKK